MAASPGFWRTVTRYDAQKIKPWIAVRNTIGVTAPLAIATALGSTSAGLVLATGALNVCFSDGDDAYRERARRMFTSTALVGVAVLVGGLSGNNNVSAVIIATLWAFAAEMMVALGQTAADIGVTSLVTLVVFAAQSLTPHKALLSGLLAACGGLFQTGLALALWRVRPYQPQSRALGVLYRELGSMAERRNPAEMAPPATTQSLDAQTSVAALVGDHSLESSRYRLLLSQAERIRLRLLMLDRLRRRFERQKAEDPAAAALGRLLQFVSVVLRSVGDSLLNVDGDVKNDATMTALNEIGRESELLRANFQDRPRSFSAATLRDSQFQIDALEGQLRAILDLTAGSTPAGHQQFEKTMARRRWTLRVGGRLATLYANLALDSAAFRHAVRLAVCVGVGDAIGRSLGLTRPYWLPMTIAIVLKPDYTATFTRGVMRLAGTYFGLVIATILVHLLPSSATFSIFWIAVFTLMVRWIGPANYTILVTGISALVVFLVSMTGVPALRVIGPRALNTTVGGALCLLVYALWPTWERTQIPELLAKMLDTYRLYIHEVACAYLRPDPSSPARLDRARIDGRRARTNAEASVDRLSAEPRTTPGEVDAYLQMLASAYRLGASAMALESGLDAAPSARAVPALELQTLADHAESTLRQIADAFRDSRKIVHRWPDLREDHRRLVAAGGPYSLVAIETDRLVNSLNTLREQVVQWAGDTGLEAAAFQTLRLSR